MYANNSVLVNESETKNQHVEGVLQIYAQLYGYVH